MSHVAIPHFSYPFRVSGSSVDVVDQGSYDDVFQGAVVVLNYEEGQREAIPEFGIPDQTLRMGGADLHQIQMAIDRWVPGGHAHFERNDLESMVDEVNVYISSGNE